MADIPIHIVANRRPSNKQFRSEILEGFPKEVQRAIVEVYEGSSYTARMQFRLKVGLGVVLLHYTPCDRNKAAIGYQLKSVTTISNLSERVTLKDYEFWDRLEGLGATMSFDKAFVNSLGLVLGYECVNDKQLYRLNGVSF